MSLDLSKTFSTDKDKELEGVWEDMGDGCSVLIARVGNKNYNEAYRSIPRGIRRMIENGMLVNERTDDVISDLLATTILLDWKGVEFEGKTIKYSIKEAKKMLLALPEWREFVWDIANDFKRFHVESIEDDSKNLSPASDGK